MLDVNVTTGIDVLVEDEPGGSVCEGKDDVGELDETMEVELEVVVDDVVDVVDWIEVVDDEVADEVVEDVVEEVVVVVDVVVVLSPPGIERGLSGGSARAATATSRWNLSLGMCCGDDWRRLFSFRGRESGVAATSAGATRTRSESEAESLMLATPK